MTQLLTATRSMLVTASGPSLMAAQSELRMQLVTTMSLHGAPGSRLSGNAVVDGCDAAVGDETSWQPSRSMPSLFGRTRLSMRSFDADLSQWMGGSQRTRRSSPGRLDLYVPAVPQADEHGRSSRSPALKMAPRPSIAPGR